MLAISIAGAVLAAGYGALHDQLSYAISPEYFTQMKFRQFQWADLGWPPRVLASVVGVLGTWWAGLVAGWFLARMGLDELPLPKQHRIAARAFAIVGGGAMLFGAVGLGLGAVVSRGDLSGWDELKDRLELADLPRFVIVAWLHAAGYVGALCGLVAGMLYVRSRRGAERRAELAGVAAHRDSRR
jgi:hypothetical protein